MMCEQQQQQPGMEARRKKAYEKQRTLEIVDLSGMSLDSLPNLPLNLGVIRELNISNNNLQAISESLIARLLNVVVLDLHSNQLESLPNSIGCLSKLEVLNISGNLIGILPKTIENCGRLEEMNANFNKLTTLPDTLGFNLPHLKSLSVNSNKLSFLPRSLSRLTSLRILDARLNNIHALPDDLETLVNLRTINISQNFHHLRTLPDSLGLLPSLVELDASYNHIAELPTSLGCLHGLQKLHVEGNPMESPPPEVTDHGVAAVKEYLCEKMQGNGKKKKTWVKKMVRFGTFNGFSGGYQKEAFIMSHYVDGLASPRVLGRFSPRRIFSNRTFFA